MIKFLKHITRILIAAPLCFLSMKYVELPDIFQILLFGAIYVLISLIIEPFFNKIEDKRNRIKKAKNEH